jgi:hypothetical protein
MADKLFYNCRSALTVRAAVFFLPLYRQREQSTCYVAKLFPFSEFFLTLTS